MSIASRAPVSGATPVPKGPGLRGAGGVARESAWLFTGYALTAAIGFVFWIIAARIVPAADLGIDAALISLVTATAAFSASGLGSALIVMLGRQTGGRLLITAHAAAVVVSGVLGAGAGVLAVVFIVPEAEPLLVVPVIAVCCIGWALVTLQGQALVGYGRAPYMIFINGPINVAKLLIIAFVAAFSLTIPHPVLTATVAPVFVAVLIVTIVVLPRVARSHDRERAASPAASAEGDHVSFTAYVMRDTAAIGMTLGVGLSLTFLVTVLAGPESGALFLICFQLGAVLDLVAVSVSMALGRAASLESELRGQALGVWRKTAVVVVVGAVGAVGATPVLFAIMGPSYDAVTATIVVALLALACVARASFELWTGLLRARRQVGRVALCAAAGMVMTLGGVFALTPLWGPVGAAAAVLLSATVLGSVGLGGLLREARSAA